jgi:hypothetical protein
LKFSLKGLLKVYSNIKDQTEMTKPAIHFEKTTRYDYIIQSALDEEVDIIGYPYTEKEYDLNGNLLRDITFDMDGAVQEHYVYVYDGKNRMVEKINYYDEEEITDTTYYHYEEGENPVSGRKVYQDGSEDTISYEYNTAGRLTGQSIRNDDGETEEESEWRFNEDGFEVFYEKREMGNPVFREQQEYRGDGKVVKVILWDGDREEETIHLISYNEEGLQNRIEKYSDKGKLLDIIHIQSFENSLPSEVVHTGPEGTSRTIYAYDPEGRPVLQQEFNSEEIMISEVLRNYNDHGFLASTEVTTNRLGQGMNMHYKIDYDYVLF